MVDSDSPICSIICRTRWPVFKNWPLEVTTPAGVPVKGMAAGYRNSRGYIQVKADTHLLYAHRLAWLHFYGEWPADQIDHINGIRDDNRIVNLRDVSQQVNAQNQRKARRPAVPSSFNTGLLGTYLCRKRWVFVAQIQNPITRRQIRLGCFATADDAHQAYLEAKRRLHEGCSI